MSAISREFIEEVYQNNPWCKEPSKDGSRVVVFGEAPAFFEGMAKAMGGSSLKAEFEAAAEGAREHYRQFVLANLDPAKIEEMCEAEPWIDRPAREFETAKFGFVPEKMERARNLFAPGSDPYKAYDEAFSKAKQAYLQQINKSGWELYSTHKGNTPQELRAGLEATSRRFWIRSEEMKDDPVMGKTYLHARIFRMAELMGHFFFDNHKGYVSPKMRNSFVMKPKGQ